MKTLLDLLEEKKKKVTEDKAHYISQEFQDYGYRLATDLGDMRHKALYIKMAKQESRMLLEKARSYVIDYPKAQSKGKLFMWAFNKLKKGEPLGFPEKTREETQKPSNQQTPTKNQS